MSETPTSNSNTPSQSATPENSTEIGPEPGPISKWLSQQGFDHFVLNQDYLGVEVIGIEPTDIRSIASALKTHGFDYLQCQGGYDEGPGLRLVSFYNLIAIEEGIAKSESSNKNKNVREVRLKVFLDRDGDLRIPSLYGLFRGADWQERETYDMFGINFDGHPHPKRLLMPEDWKGWPLRKDYVQPDFYEMQDAY